MGAVAAALLSGCLFSTREEAAPAACGDGSAFHSDQIRPGVYRGLYGSRAGRSGIETELILDGHGCFRYFMIDSNTAFYTSKGRWSAIGNQMIQHRVVRSPLYHGDFKNWDTLNAPDSSFLRNVSENAFERLESYFDSLGAPVMIWVPYRRVPPQPPLRDGRYEFLEFFRDWFDSTAVNYGVTRIQLVRGGYYTEQKFQNGKPLYEVEDSLWRQEGSFFVSTASRIRFPSDSTGFTDWLHSPRDYEFITRLRNVGETSFEFWLGPDYTVQAYPEWATFRAKP